MVVVVLVLEDHSSTDRVPLDEKHNTSKGPGEGKNSRASQRLQAVPAVSFSATVVSSRV